MLGDHAKIAEILRDPEAPSIPEKDRALLRFVKKAASASVTMTMADADAARAAGWTDEALYDAATVVALFRFYNTWCDSHGVHAMPVELHALSGKRLAQNGYG